MIEYLKRVAGWFFAGILWLWTFLPKTLDWVGRTTLPDDWRQLMDDSMPAALNWLFSTPSWVPAILASILTLWLIWISLPREMVSKTTKKNIVPKYMPSPEIVKSRVHFSFLSNWEPPLRQDSVAGGYAEELWLGLRADGNIENLKLNVKIFKERELKSEFFLETDFKGVIPKGLEHKIKIFRLEWEWISGRFIPNLEPDSKPTQITYKKEKGAIFFDGSTNQMEVLKGHNYLLIIKALHSDGPDVAQFKIRQGGYRPETIVDEIKNIEIVRKVTKAQFGECYLS